MAAPSTSKPRVFSGIQPTGRKTLGNYSGGFRQYVQTQAVGDAFFCIVDLHSISVEYDPAELRRSTLDLAALLFAAGLDAERSTVFCQSHVTAHAEAAWLLSSVTSHGQLGRMTQFKDKSESKEFVSAALFTYPVLMAGDILLYQTDLVPIGDDQRQHLELARDVAERFNYRFGETFRVPGGQFPEIGGRIMDLQEPTNKMSTSSSSEQGAVYISDTPDEIRKKFKSAVTDSEREIRYDPAAKPGVSNLLEIMSVATGEPIDALETQFASAGYGDLKEAVGESVVQLLAPMKERFAAVRADERELQRLLAVGAEKARNVSQPTLELMYERMGFVKPEAGRFFGAVRPRGL
jgi:tryptophanyl-tRNA synthetase